MLIRTCIVIPTYNHTDTLRSVVEESLTVTQLPLIVVDDGSTIAASTILAPHSRVTIIRNEKNLGKGASLQKAFKEALKLGYTHVLTIDSDGQHPVKEIHKLIEASEKAPMHLIIGMRDLTGKHVPEISKFGRKFSNFWVNYETGTEIKDSQSGLRIYPLFPLQTMRFFCKRYDFEIEVLIRLMWKGTKVVEVPMHCVYQEKEKRISHFNKFKDNFRISILNTLLIAASLFRQNLSPFKSSLALALGVLVGTTPFFGFHTPIVILLSLLCPLNLGLLWLGTQISLPPLAPLLTVGSIKIGRMVLKSEIPVNFPIELSEAKLFFSQWLSGSIILGLGLGTIAFLISYSIFKVKDEIRPTNQAWSGKRRGGRFGNWFLLQVLKYLGFRAAYFCLFFIVPYFFVFAPRGTYSAMQYWRVMDPKASLLKRIWLTLKQYYQFGVVLLDRLGFELLSSAELVSNSKGFEHILDRINKKEGVIMLGAHTGSWEVASKRIYSDWHVDSFHTVQFSAEKKKALEKTPEPVKTIYKNLQSHASLDIQALLKSGMPVGMMADRPTTARYELVPFFGSLLPIDISPFRVSLALDVPIVFTFGFRNSFKAYDFYALPAKSFSEYKGNSKEEQIYEWAKDFAKTLEDFVRRYPYQWFNFFPVFSHPPVA